MVAGPRLLFDVETNGLLDREDLVVHCGVVIDIDTGAEETYVPGDGERLVERLEGARLVAGHNVAGFDIPVLERLYGYDRWRNGKRQEMLDTLSASQLIFASNILARTSAFQRAGGRTKKQREAQFPSRLFQKPHSLEAWGYRLKLLKKVEGISYDRFSPELMERCVVDARINLKLFWYLLTRGAARSWQPCSERSLLVESEIAYLHARQERNGVGFDEQAAMKLYNELAVERQKLTEELRELYQPWWRGESGQDGYLPDMPHQEGDSGYTVCKRERTVKKGRTFPVTFYEGSPYTKIELIEFNPGSSMHRADRLMRVHGWEPGEDDFTPEGRISTDREVLDTLPFPGCAQMSDYSLVAKRMGYIGEPGEKSKGKAAKSWMDASKGKGIIHAPIKPTGTRTSRSSHSYGVAQVGKVKVDESTGTPLMGRAGKWGYELRSLFRPTRRGYLMVGADASGIELRMLAHRLAFYDGGAFWLVLKTGNPHREWMKSTGIFFYPNQKTFTYAMLYGAGDEKLGRIIIADWIEAYRAGLTSEKPPSLELARDLGTSRRGRLLRDMPALAMLLDRCRRAFRRRWFPALDGRVLAMKSEHGALNDVLQSDGAIAMKWANRECMDRMVETGMLGNPWRVGQPGYREDGLSFKMLDNHDEWQYETPPDDAPLVGEIMVGSIRRAGELLELRVPLDGEFHVGRTWAETH